MAAPVVIDLETQHSFREVGGYEPKKLKVSVAGLYDYATDKYLTFTEGELSKLFPYLENASAIIGFNHIDFDLPALSPYYVGDLTKFPAIDLLVHVQNALGHRLSLDHLAQETLSVSKTGHGLLAIEYFRAGEMQKLKDYCLSDVKITKELYEYGKTHGKIFYKNMRGRVELPVNWGTIESTKPADVNLTLPW